MQHATHVLIRGHVFTYTEKAPFTQAGMSVMGALEYDENLDKTKCHECGTWINGLGQHIKVHGFKRSEYNRRFGLSRKTALSGLQTREKHRSLAERQQYEHSGLASDAALRQREVRRPGTVNGIKSGPRAVEFHNEKGRCAAQMLFRIQVCAAEMGHTPTQSDLRHAGLSIHAIGDRFGSVAKALSLAGLQTNRGNVSPLPRSFPAKDELEAKWNARMPWPEDYGAITPDRALRRLPV